jgi:Domain of unknown function (DUF4404)
MTQDRLRTALDALRAEMRSARVHDPVEHQRVVELIDEIERGGAAGEGRDALLERIGATVRRLEVEHPVLTGCLGQIAAALSAMGI